MKRILISLFTIVMVIGLMTTAAFAADTDEACIGNTNYATLEAAAEKAIAGQTITLLNDVTLEEALTLPAGITLNGNGKSINGTIVAGGNLTFAGETKVTSFSAGYYDRVITIGAGASLEITGTGRMTVAYGNTFNITGTISDAKTADKANITPSLKVPGGMSITGSSDATFNVTNAYIVIGSTTSKPGVANGTFTFNFTNSIVDVTKNFCFYESTGDVAPTFNMTIKDSVMDVATNLVYSNTGCNTTIDNSNVAVSSSMRNSGEMTVKNGADVSVAAMIQFGENAGNDGTITVDNATLDIDCSSAGHAIDGKGTGKIVATNGASVDVGYITDSEVAVSGETTLATKAISNSDVKLENGAELTVEGTLNNIDITTDVTCSITAVDITGESSVAIDASNAPIRGEISVLNLTSKDSTGNAPTFDTTNVTISNGGEYVDTTTDENGNIIFVDNTPLMIVGEAKVGFNDLQQAIDSIPDGEKTTIKLLGDILNCNIPGDKTEYGTGKDDCVGWIGVNQIIELDLNGFTIQGVGADTNADTAVAICNYGNLTIKDSSEDQSGLITLSFDGTNYGNSSFFSTIVNYGTLTFESGNIENKATTGYNTVGIRNYSWGGNAVLTIKGGTISSDTSYAVRSEAYDDFSKYVCKVYVSGGVLDGGLYYWHQGYVAENGAVLEITGGEFNATSAYALRVREQSTDNLTNISVSEGVFEGDIIYANSMSENVPAFISGGTFTSDVSAYCTDGFEVFQMAPGEYAVAEDKPYTVTYIGYGSETVQAGTVLPEFRPDNDGYELVGWYTEPELVNSFDFSRPIIEDVTLYPMWKTDYHDIDTGYVMIIMKMLKKLDISVEIIEAEGGKIVVVEPENVKYNKPAVCTIVADEGYAVADVIVDGESVGAVTEYTIEKLKGKHTITAVFEKITADTDGEQ